MIVYVETSAAAKVFFAENETVALKNRLDEYAAEDVSVVSSMILETELRRAAVREGASQAAVTEILDRFDLIDLDRTVFREAGLLPGTQLGSLDALHVAAALRIDADIMISYDQRHIAAAENAGLRVLSPA